MSLCCASTKLANDKLPRFQRPLNSACCHAAACPQTCSKEALVWKGPLMACNDANAHGIAYTVHAHACAMTKNLFSGRCKCWLAEALSVNPAEAKKSSMDE